MATETKSPGSELGPGRNPSQDEMDSLNDRYFNPDKHDNRPAGDPSDPRGKPDHKHSADTGQPTNGSIGTSNAGTSNDEATESSLYKTAQPQKPNIITRFSGLSRKRKTLLGGGLAGIILAAIFGFIALLPLELIHIEKNMLAYESRVEKRFEQAAAKQIMKKIAKSQKSKAAKAAEDAQAKAAGETLTQQFDEFPTDKLAADLEKQGFKATLDANGDMTNLVAPSGEPIDLANMSDAEFGTLETALPEWDVGQLDTFRSMNLVHSGVSYDVLPDTPNDDVNKTLEDKVLNGASADEYAADLATLDEKPPTAPDPTDKVKDPKGVNDPAYKADLAAYEQSLADYNSTVASGGGGLKPAIDAAEQTFEKTGDTTAAVDAGVAAFDSTVGSTLLATYVVTTGCTVEKEVSTAADARVPIIMKLLIRHGNLLLTLASQLKLGKISASELNQVMQILNGNQSAKPGTNGLPTEASRPFTDSAAWHRATGLGVNNDPTSVNYTPDISNGVRPTRNGATKIVDEIDSLMAKFGGKRTCKALTSPWGTLVQFGAGIAQVVGDIGSFGALQVGITVGNIAFQTALNFLILPDVIKYFTNVGITGAEDAVQWLNNSDAGLDLSYNDYGRRIGAKPLTTTQAVTLGNEAAHEQIAEEARKPFMTRMFALSDPVSVASRAVDRIPTSPYAILATMSNYFTSMQSNLGHVFSTIFHPQLALAATIGGVDPYGVTQYAFTDDEIGKYDPITNEQYLFSPITVPTLNDGTEQVKRIVILGNPATYNDSPTGDPNDGDLLHCFVNTYAQLNSADANKAHQEFCGGIGNYDYANGGAVLPDDNTIAKLYCNYEFTHGAKTISDKDLLNAAVNACAPTLLPQLSDEVGHFRQYLLDTHIMNDYLSLTNAQ